MKRPFFVGRVALVTGASAGIGRAAALALAKEGASLALLARRPGPLAEMAAAVQEVYRAASGTDGHVGAAAGKGRGADGANAAGAAGRQSHSPVPGALTLEADVRDASQVAQAVECVLERFGRLDVLVNSAGVPAVGAVADLPPEAAERAITTNVLGTIYATQAALVPMRRQGWGRIVNLGSVAGLVATPGMAVYSASKFAVVAFTEALRAELRGACERGIAVSVVCPTYVPTPLLEAELAAGPLVGYDPRAVVSAEQVADAILRAARTGTGQIVLAPPGQRFGLLLARLFPGVRGPVMARMYALARQRS